MTNNQQGSTRTSSLNASRTDNNSIDMPSVTLGGWLAVSSRRLGDYGFEADLSTAMADVRLLAAKIVGITKTQAMAHPELKLTNQQLSLLDAGLTRLLAGEALPYVLGEWEFYGRTFTVSPQVLIPRPETELMIEQVLKRIDSHRVSRIIDVGTGSGCIAVTLAMELHNSQIIAVDVSNAALRIARENIARYDLREQVHLMQADLLTAVAPESMEVICANLPYCPTARLQHLAVAKREPLLALDGGMEGLDLINRLIPQAARLLTPGGWALLEIDDTHTESVLRLAEQKFPGNSQVLDDYQGKPRLLILEKRKTRIEYGNNNHPL